jgi:hypothetical protein
MAYQFVRTKEFVAQYQENNTVEPDTLWLDILNDAVNQAVSVGGKVVSIGYDQLGEPMTILFDVATDAPADFWTR